VTPSDHLEQVRRLYSLGLRYRDRYQRIGAEADLALAIQQYQEALYYIPSPTLDRLRPVNSLLFLQTVAERWLLAYQTANTAVSLISLLTPRALENSDKQHLLMEVSGLASSAAAVALMAEKTPYEAMRLLELGRGLIIGSLNEMRVDISDLLQKHPRLAEQYIKLRDQLNAPPRQVGQLDTPIVVTRQGNQRYDVGRNLDFPSTQRGIISPALTLFWIGPFHPTAPLSRHLWKVAGTIPPKELYEDWRKQF
jgi:hypothetical protein